MCKGRLSVCLFLLVSVAAGLPAQDRRLIVVNPSEKELVREANRLGTCPERLKNGREALWEALQMAPEVAKLIPVQLGSHLLTYESKQASQLISRLYEKLLDEAGGTTDAHEQASLHASGMDLISALKKRNPDLAARLESRWPKRAKGLGENLEDAEISIRLEIHEKMRANPEQALLELPLAEAGGADLNLRARLLGQLSADGKTEAARRLLDETLGLPLVADSRAPLAFGRFIRFALAAFPDSRDRLLSAFSNWYQIQIEAGGPEADFRLPSGEVLRVSEADHALLSQLAFVLRMYPEFSEHVAALSPTLKSRIQSAGSLSGLFAWNTENRTQLRQSIAEASSLEMEAIVAGSSSVRDLTAAVSEVCSDSELEKRESLFRALIRRIESEPDPGEAASLIMSFGYQCTSCLGEFPEDWFNAGKNIVWQLHEAEQQDQSQATSLPERHGLQTGPAADLEGFIYARRGRTDFATVMDEVRAIKEKPRAFMILMRMILDLRAS